MKQKLIAFVLKRINWGKLLPALLRMVAEGKLDEALGLTAAAGIRSYPFRRLYWKLAGLKTFTGMALLAIGTGLEAVAGAYPEVTWAAPAARAALFVGSILAAVGLADGGTRSPWPVGTPKEGPWPAA